MHLAWHVEIPVGAAFLTALQHQPKTQQAMQDSQKQSACGGATTRTVSYYIPVACKASWPWMAAWWAVHKVVTVIEVAQIEQLIAGFCGLQPLIVFHCLDNALPAAYIGLEAGMSRSQI